MSGYCAFRTMERSELQAISRRGGIASGKARREQRRIIEDMKIARRAELESIFEETKLLKQIYREMI